MIIDDFHIVGITALPYEANAPLLVNSYAVLIGILSQKDNIVKRYRHSPCIEIPGVNEKPFAEMVAIFKGRLI
jgi:hypothetical protein